MTSFIQQLSTFLGISSTQEEYYIIVVICFSMVLEFIGNLVTNVFAMGHKLTRF